ncbi:MAG TPA: OmpH family outer membrane protein [Luteibaculaceae bacterium]|nr:OmpH family outer membrane protein [Luteibaculaceae bacterium]
MKRIIAVISLIIGSHVAMAQAPKLAHIDSQDLLLAMPERADAEKKVQDFAKNLENTLKTMSTEYQSKVADYQSKEATMTKTERETAETEILQLQQRIQDFQVSAQEKIKKQEAELLQPMIDKVKKAIEDVGKEGGYTYIFDSSVGVTLYEGGEDIMPKVKLKLGLK